MRLTRNFSNRVPPIGRRFTKSVAAFGASVVMTMRIFGEPPQGRLRRTNVIEQIYEDVSLGPFDPREIVKERLVLTLPLPSEPLARRGNVRINSN
jgi:hypothetical protein